MPALPQGKGHGQPGQRLTWSTAGRKNRAGDRPNTPLVDPVVTSPFSRPTATTRGPETTFTKFRVLMAGITALVRPQD